MQKKINNEYLDEFCTQFAKNLVSQYFVGERTIITGRDILTVTSCKQINFYIIKLLFEYWKKDVETLKNPYFDYSHMEVKKALSQFMNLLSQHISVESFQFESLLDQATRESIRLIIDPAEYLTNQLRDKQTDVLEKIVINDILRYLQVYKKEVSDFLIKRVGYDINEVIADLPNELAHYHVEETLKQETDLLYKIHPFEMDRLINNDIELKDLDFLEEDLLVDEMVRKDDDVQDGIEKPKDELFEPVIIEESESHDETKVVRKQQVEEKTNAIINDLFEKKDKTVAEHHEEQNDSKLGETISLNQQYMFVRVLFKNNKTAFANALKELERFGNFDESVKFLIQNYAKQYTWDMHSEEVKEFLKVLFRKYR